MHIIQSTTYSFYTKWKVINIFILRYQNVSSLRIVRVLPCGHTYNIMHIISWKKLSYNTRWRPILKAISGSGHLHATFLPHIYCCIYIHRSGSAPLFEGHATKCSRHMSDTLAGISAWRTCHVMLHWTLLKKYKCHWLPMSKLQWAMVIKHTIICKSIIVSLF